MYINTVIFGDLAKIGEGRRCFGRELKCVTDDVIDFLGNGLMGTGKGKIVDLAKEEDCVSFENGLVDGFVVGCVGEVEVGGEKDGVDVMFP